MKKVGLYFGSFNPIHIGHLIVASSIRECAKLDEVWFIVSPHNPFKSAESLIHEDHRLNMCKLSIDNHDYLSASDIEFKLEKPSYTIYTLKHLKEKYFDIDFQLIMGEDNLLGFKNWKLHDQILDLVDLHIYKRKLDNNAFDQLNIKDLYSHSKIHFYDVPLLNISSTYVRNQLSQGKSIDFLCTNSVVRYINDNGLYQSKENL